MSPLSIWSCSSYRGSFFDFMMNAKTASEVIKTIVPKALTGMTVVEGSLNYPALMEEAGISTEGSEREGILTDFFPEDFKTEGVPTALFTRTESSGGPTGLFVGD